VKCWGKNDQGQLGQGGTGDIGDQDDEDEMGDALDPVDLGSGRTAVSISAGEGHTCAILDNNDLKCWGRNNSAGQLGLEETGHRGDQSDEMGDALPVVDLGTGRTATALAGGVNHTCAILNTGAVKCWGTNNAGQLGLGDTDSRGADAGDMGDNLPEVDLGDGYTAVAIAAAQEHSCAILEKAGSDDVLKCWGEGGTGQLGLGNSLDKGDGGQNSDMGDALLAVDLGEGRSASAVAAGHDHTCAILDNNAVKCWGFNDNGQLGLGNMDDIGDNLNEMGNNLLAVDFRACILQQ
jgi:alpha-tubulin suppressor-like RCC1 family protein